MTSDSQTPLLETPARDDSYRDDRRGRKRALLGLGSLLAVSVLATSAYFTATALLDLNGSGGFGSANNRYNIQVSTGMENTVASVASWIDASPDSAAIEDIPGASTLVPGNSIVVKIPVRNDSRSWDSTVNLSLKNTTATEGVPAEQRARNDAYLKLMTVDVAQTNDASVAPTTWTQTGLTIPSITGSSSEGVDFRDLAPQAGTILYLRLTLNQRSQPETDAANGGTAMIQAVINGTSKTSSPENTRSPQPRR